MSYTPTEWKTGDVITAEKLNNMEDGIVNAGRVLKVTITENEDDGYIMDKTCAEIKSAIMNRTLIWTEKTETLDNETAYEAQWPIYIFKEGGGCEIEVSGDLFIALTDNDYPSTSGK